MIVASSNIIDVTIDDIHLFILGSGLVVVYVGELEVNRAVNHRNGL